MRILNIHAHFDDFEFTAAGTFLLWQQKWGDQLRARVLVCTDGEAGHHLHTRAETGRIRRREQEASARLGGYEYALLRYPDGTVPREACLNVDRPLLAALWQAIREFEPDYLFCPPLPTDPLAGVHVDHLAIAEAVRKVAYLINVPHCYTPEYPSAETVCRPCKVPVILTVYDGYMPGRTRFHFAVNIEPVFDRVSELTYCHHSQIAEWLPWVGRHAMSAPSDLAEWRKMLRKRFRDRNRELGLGRQPLAEVFTLTRWGELATRAQIRRDFPKLIGPVRGG
jgi:LmbE family N-acetylglucosaminyl deacetylase